jgi:two-component system, NtrC family, sensor kinase
MLFLTLGTDMARPSRTGGKKSEAKARNASPAKGRKTTLKKRPIARAATRAKRPQVSSPSEDLKEAREQQAATAEILKVIASSPSDVQPVFDAIVRSAAKLFEPCSATITTLKDDKLCWGATAASISGFDVERVRSVYPIPFDPDRAPSARAMLERRIVEIPDVAAPATPEFTRNAAAAGGFRSITFAPLVDREQGIGTIIFTHPQAGFRYSERQLALIQTFADQAVIAIRNARLFNETQEALERQTATADILKVIARSPSEVQPVFEAIATSAKRLLGGFSTAVFRILEATVHLAAFTPVNPVADQALKADFPQSTENFVAFRLAQHGEPVVIADTEEESHAPVRDIARLHGFRSMLWVPMVNGGVTIGIISVTRAEPGGFAPHHIQLLQTFADQAVIAIDNVRLFDEVQAKTRDLTESLEQQTATSEVLEVISASSGELQPVFQKMLENATRICGANFGTMGLYDGDMYHNVALYNVPPAFADTLQTFRPHPKSGLATATRNRQAFQIEDVRTNAAYQERDPAVVALSDRAGARTIVNVPMLRENEPIGVITIYRQEVRPFNAKQIDLLANFAKQVVIAIENARLLRELRQRTADLSKSLDDLRTAQDRLIQTEKLASLGQLTAGIAHEIKNPLNFVNNFSALSVELVEELNDILKPAPLDNKTRVESDELTHMLKSNLEKVVQHGKRADSIVKNMLLHSREGSTERRLVNLNGLVEECLNLAYHGARAENHEFNINLERSFDPTIGRVDLFPQEMTRVLLNLISNGVYAATKRKAETKLNGYEPTLAAATINLGDRVEIRIRDNGNGIPAEVMDKIFNPFFTTKPPGEGTGLGLSLSHDIVVKQHAGSIEVDTRPGEFTEFKIVLPRTAATGKAGADK